jgi:hypothetical protein
VKMPWKILFLMFGLDMDSLVLTMHRTTKVNRQDVFRRNALDSRRTIMRRTTDPSRSTKRKVSQDREILVQIQFVRPEERSV